MFLRGLWDVSLFESRRPVWDISKMSDAGWDYIVVICSITNRIKFLRKQISLFLFWDLKSLHFTCSHLFSFVVLLAAIHCHSLSFVLSRYHLLSLVVPVVVTHCTARCHSLSLDVPLANPKFSIHWLLQ